MKMIGVSTLMCAAMLFASLAICSIGPAHAQARIDQNDAASLASRVGVATTKLWLDQGGVDIPPSELPPDAQYGEIEDALARYEALRDSFSGAAKAGSAMEISVAGIAGGLALFTPAAPVPILVGAGALIGLNVANEGVERVGKEQATSLLAAMRDDLVRASGAEDFSSLADDPDLLRQTVVRSANLLQDVKTRASTSGDDALIDLAADIIQRTAFEVDIATLDSIAHLGNEVNELDTEFGDFVQRLHESNSQIADQLDQHTAQINDLGGNIKKLSKDIAEVHEEVGHLGQNQDLLVDFMFSDMPPDRKVLALKSGLMDDRIQCPEGADAACNRDEIRATLIERYETETKIKNNIATAAAMLQGINDIQAITTNLGIDVGEEGRAIFKFAGGAVNAYMSILSGNPLGAIAAVTSIFSNRPDPDAERFRITMTYMKEQFGAINEKLVDVLENQQKIADALNVISKQLQRDFEMLDSRLRRMEWEQRRISINLKELMWAEWRSCYSMYRYTLAPNPAESAAPLANPDNLKFHSFQHIRSVIDGRGDQIKECLSTVHKAMDSVSATKWFGSFLDTRRALRSQSFVELGTLPASLAEETERWRSMEQWHWEDVVRPAMAVVGEWASRNNVTPSALLRLQMLRIASVRELRAGVDRIVNGYPIGCDLNSEEDWALRELICVPNTDLDATARDLMEFAIDAEILLEIGNWMEVLSQIADLYRSGTSHFAGSLEELTTFPSASLGEEIIRKSVSMMGLAMAYYARTYGGIAALAVAEDILSGSANEMHIKALANNPFLAENAALLLLHLKRGSWNLAEDRSSPSFENMYAQALLHARSEAETRFDPLLALFGREHDFSTSDEGTVGFSIAVDDGFAFLPLPPPIRLYEGSFTMPVRYHALGARQDRLLDKYFDYQMGKNMQLAIVVLQR